MEAGKRRRLEEEICDKIEKQSVLDREVLMLDCIAGEGVGHRGDAVCKMTVEDFFERENH